MIAGDQTRLLDLQQRAKTTGVGEAFQAKGMCSNTSPAGRHILTC
jgi:hypothetical protein